MSAEPARTTRDAVQALIERLDEDQLEGLLFHIENELLPREPLTEQQVTEIRRRLDGYRPGTGIPHEEVMRRFGLHD